VILSLEDFLDLRETLPVVDVRSEGEFQHGHIQGAVNIPLLNNEERIIVGTAYKNAGQKRAISEGFRLVGPRLSGIIEAVEAVGDEFVVHCWRGGMRSSNFCQFAGMAGLKTHQLRGGYKVYRRAAIDSFSRPLKLNVISGYTGSGKTELLQELKRLGEQVLDLEGLAKHKGSVFGGLGMPLQPTTEQFQNDLFEEIRKLDATQPVWVEDESIAIGKIFLPDEFWRTLRNGAIIEVTVPKEVRIQRLVSEYGNVPVESFQAALQGIVKKLGGQHYNTACEKLFAGDLAASIDVILHYYDKAYGNGMERKKDRVALRVDWDGHNLAQFAETLVRRRKKSTTAYSVNL
jgi:tRNA 2-selenouridine synthase